MAFLLLLLLLFPSNETIFLINPADRKLNWWASIQKKRGSPASRQWWCCYCPFSTIFFFSYLMKIQNYVRRRETNPKCRAWLFDRNRRMNKNHGEREPTHDEQPHACTHTSALARSPTAAAKSNTARTTARWRGRQRNRIHKGNRNVTQ